MAGPGEQVVAFGLARDLAGRVVGEGQRLVARRAGQIVDLAGEPRDGVVAVSGDGAVAAGQAGAAAKVTIKYCAPESWPPNYDALSRLTRDFSYRPMT